jgi:ATP-dependent DNA helicase RecQ
VPAPDPEARRVLKDVFGYDSYRPAQEPVVAAVLAGASVLAVMPTGSGKSLCFQIPALVGGGLTVVVSPLVALMEDQVAALRLAGVAAETINSSHDRDTNTAAWRRVAAGETRLLYIAPERLMTEPMLRALGRLALRRIVVDEAHCISRWGPAFRPDYEQLSELGARFAGVPIAAFTATADQATRADIAAKLFVGDSKIFVSGFDRPNIRLGVGIRRDWRRQLLGFARRRAGESGIVYCLSRKKTEEAAALLAGEGVPALAYHAGMEKAARAANQDAFMTEPGVVMVATIAFGMGIDKPDVRYVYHTDLPANVEAYYQEIGRAGRDGRPADAHMLYGLDDIRMRRTFIAEAGDEAHQRREHKRLDLLIAYCESPECRRQSLLAYFGETTEPCANCDVCENPPEVEDGTLAAQKALSTVHRTGQRFGAAHLIDVLRGADTEKVRAAGHDRLPTYGAGGDIAKDDWRSILRQLVATGFLQLDVKGHGGLSITPRGHELLAGEETFRYRKDALPVATKAAPKGRPPKADLTASEGALFNALKAQRLMLAHERGVPAYVIFPDRALADLARHKPANEIEFAQIHGVGAAKLRDFATPFLTAIAEFVKEAG